MKNFFQGALAGSMFCSVALGLFYCSRAMADEQACIGRGGSSPPTCTGLPDPCPTGSACKHDTATTNKCKCLNAGAGGGD